MLRIAIITYQYPPGIGQSGIANYTCNLAQGLVSRGNEVHVIAHTDPEEGDEQELLDGKVRVHRIREPKWTQKISLLKVFAYRFRIYRKTNELYKKYGLDIVECPNSIFQGVLLSPLSRRFPVVMRVHTPMFEIFESSFEKIPFRFKVISFLEKLAVLKADALVTSTEFYAEKVSNAYKISKDRFTVVPLGITIPEKEQLNLMPNNDKVQILFVGRLEERKGIRYLLEAVPEVISHCSEAEFVFVGEDVGNFRKPFEGKINQEVKECVRFEGHVSEKELNAFYRDSDIYVGPSLSESFGLMFAEAMSWGKPVVACDVCAVSNIVANKESGYLVPPKNSKAIADALIDLVKDRRERQRMGARGREICEEMFSLDTMTNNMEKFYQSVVDDKKG